MSSYDEIIATLNSALKVESIILENESAMHNVPIDSETHFKFCLLYTSPSPRDMRRSRTPSSA